MVGKIFTRQVTKNVIWKVEVISETLTHVYLKILEPLEGRRTHRCHNVSKSWFFDQYKELV